MRRKNQYLMLPLAAVAVSMLAGCSSMSSLLGQNQPVLSPAAKAAAEMPLEKEPVVNTQETYLSLVKQMQAKSLWYASIAHLDALDKQWGASSDSRLMRADALRQVGQFNAAATIYQGLLGSAKDGAARYGLGRIAAEKGDFRNAAQQMEQARMSNPVDSQLLTDLGYAHLRARDLNAARIPLMQAAQLNPEDAQANVNLSLFMMVSGQAPQAEEFMRQRKLDAQTQQAVKEQASEWLKGAKQAAAPSVPDPATQATGKVVNLSRPEVTPPAETVAKTAAPAPAQEPAQLQEVPAAKKSLPEPEVAQAPVMAAAQPPAFVAVATFVTAPAAVADLPLPAAQPMLQQSVARAPSGGQWMVSGSSFDSARPRYPGQFTPSASQTYAYAAPATVQAAPVAHISATVAVVPPVVEVAATRAPVEPKPAVPAASQALVVVQEPVRPYLAPATVQKAPVAPASVATLAPAAVQKWPEQQAPVLRPEAANPSLNPSVVPPQPTRPARSLQEGSVVMAVASPAAVRLANPVSDSKQAVQAILPHRSSSGGLFFETPEVEASSQSASSAKTATPERVWP